MRPALLARSVVTAWLLAMPGRLLPAQSAVAASYESDPKFVKQLADAKAAEKQSDYLYSAEAYKKANKIAGGQCFSCLQAAYDLDMKVGNYKDAAGLGSQMLLLATTPRDKSLTKIKQAEAMLRMAGDHPKPDKMEPVHALLQSAMTDDPSNLGASFIDAGVLARMGRLDDASKQFLSYAAATSADDPFRTRAQLLAGNPNLSTESLAPPFIVAPINGESFSLDAMRGKVVLIDFWATWNGPSKDELSNVRKIVNQFGGQPLVVLTVSWDQDDAGWRAYVANHDMKWLQYRDDDHKLTGLFGVKWIPEYYLIDSNGVLLPGRLTDGSSLEDKLKPLLERANEAREKGQVVGP